jgi:uncharacterized protein
VNSVGVELNTASAPLLARVAGIGPSLAKRIVSHRNRRAPSLAQGAARGAGLGPKTFEQCAGFVRVRGGEHPLDASAVHPERYPASSSASRRTSACRRRTLVGNAELVAKIDAEEVRLSGDVGEFTLRRHPGRAEEAGPRPAQDFEPPKFRDDVRTMDDLKPGMALEGVVTNVTAFGAFVDIGVHQDGLVHVSQLSDRFVQGPERGREGGRQDQGARARGRPGAQAHRSSPRSARPRGRNGWWGRVRQRDHPPRGA